MKLQAAIFLSIASLAAAKPSWTINAWKDANCMPPKTPSYPNVVLNVDQCHTFTQADINAAHSIATVTNSGNLPQIRWALATYSGTDCIEGTRISALDLWGFPGCSRYSRNVLSVKLVILPGVQTDGATSAKGPSKGPPKGNSRP
ncbi:hypothetical protein B0O99DRAFT_640867 [Bisporella sp. PMI_857]|nr:hypothetical protein B0O99DRAFT_640867 [Bisporella sp. PMI_857]